jgi:hypothetical protein
MHAETQMLMHIWMHVRLSTMPIEKNKLLQVESYFFDIRRQLFEYDQVMNTQRDKVHTHTLTRLAFIITIRVTCTQSMPCMPDACCRGPSQLVFT